MIRFCLSVSHVVFWASAAVECSDADTCNALEVVCCLCHGKDLVGRTWIFPRGSYVKIKHKRTQFRVYTINDQYYNKRSLANSTFLQMSIRNKISQSECSLYPHFSLLSLKVTLLKIIYFVHSIFRKNFTRSSYYSVISHEAIFFTRLVIYCVI